MLLFRRAKLLHKYISQKKAEGCSVGFVPTMGALHAGHLSLIKQAGQDGHLVVCSIFVNPTQFNDPADLEKYPRPIEKDIEQLVLSGCAVLFLPSTEEIYPQGTKELKRYDLDSMDHRLEGASRPGHFQGVANVVHRFLQLVQPDWLYLGQKDFQQVVVIKKLIDGERLPVQVAVCPIVREADGLAMSSRNVRLTSEQRKNAAGIFGALCHIRNDFGHIELKQLKQEAIRQINAIPEAQVDYLEFCDANTFKVIHQAHEASKIVCVTAVKVGDVRLLDNMILN